ncbi:hypothetical protein BC629DRAFT_322244 [Irpex lacteus]|nr:hypothetical protein BC629DRAFT_322244 [Irpex lacteus]
MRRIVEACGMDCKTATVDDLDRADIRLRCVCISHLKDCQWRPIMTWRMAMANWVRERGRCAHFEKATDAETAAAKPMEAVALALFKKQWDEQNKFLCCHCSGSHMTKSWVLSHIQESHAIAEPSDDDWVDAHNTMQIPYPVWLVSAKLHNEAPAYPTSVWFRDGVAAYFED